MTSVNRKALLKWITENEPEFVSDVVKKIKSGAFPSTESEGEAERYRAALEKIVNRQGYSYAEGHYMRQIAQEALSSTSETAVQLRPAVQQFAEYMEKVLKHNDHKGGWNECTDDYLLDRLQEEVKELISAVRGRKARNPELRIRNEAADVANFAMMIADNARLSLPGITDGREGT